MRETDLITDETLTAFLDGALDDAEAETVFAALQDDPALADRLAALDLPMEDLRAVMDPITLGAPAMPEGILAANDTNAPRHRLWVPAAIAVAFAAGLAISGVLQRTPQSQADWVEAVASYQALYVTQTLATPRQSDALTQDVLGRAGAAFEVALDPALEIEGLTFKRAQMLGWNGGDLLQMAYLTADGTPMALCLTRVDSADHGPVTSVSHALAGVNWVQDGIGFYLVGGQDPTLVEALSLDVIAQLAQG